MSGAQTGAETHGDGATGRDGDVDGLPHPEGASGAPVRVWPPFSPAWYVASQWREQGVTVEGFTSAIPTRAQLDLSVTVMREGMARFPRRRRDGEKLVGVWRVAKKEMAQ